MSARTDLLDDDGENRALRSFLMQYSCDRAVTVGAMLAHMNRSGWRDAAPAFALEVRPETHLTKAGAQLWIRHLISMEAATHPSPIPAQTPNEVPFIRQKCNPTGEWVEITREALDAMETRVRSVFDVRTLYTAPVEASLCPTCPKDTPYGPAFCGKCMEAREATAEDGLTVEQVINDAYPVACCSIGEVEDRTIELRGFRKGFAAALASHIKAGGQVGSTGDAIVEAARKLVAYHPNTLRILHCDGEPTGRNLVAALSKATNGGSHD